MDSSTYHLSPGSTYFTHDNQLLTAEVATESQLDIINHPATPNTILSIRAGPGSGKTYTLTRRITQLVQHGIEPSSILVLSMANRSVNSLKQSIRNQLGDRADEVDISTFHSFCGKIIDNYGDRYLPSKNRKLLMDDSRWRFLSMLLSNRYLKLNGVNNKGLTSTKLMKILDEIRIGGDIINVAKKYQTSENYIEAVLDYLESNGIMRYGDLISNACKIIALSLNMDKIDQLLHYKVIIVDEFQDMHEELLKVIEMVVNYPSDSTSLSLDNNEPSGKHLTIAGDPNQSIYEFLGSDPDLMNVLESHFQLPVTHKFIRESFRCTPEIINLSKTLIPDSKLKSYLYSTRQSGHLPVLKKFTNPSDEMHFIVEEIVRLCYFSGGGITLNDIMILSRTNKQLDEINRILSENYGIKTNKLTSSISWNKSRVSVFLSILNIIENSSSSNLSILYLLSIFDNSSHSRVSKIFQISRTQPYENVEELVFSEKAEKIYRNKKNILEDFKKFINIIKLQRKQSLASPNEVLEALYTIVSNGLLDHLNENCESLENRKKLLVELTNFQNSLNLSFTNYTVQQPSDRFVEFFLKTYTDDISIDSPTSVRISTIHAAKGIESKVVFIIGTSNFSQGSWDSILRGHMKDHEKTRLFYVALTRAKDLVYITSSLNISDVVNDDLFTTVVPNKKSIRSIAVKENKINIGEKMYNSFKRGYHSSALSYIPSVAYNDVIHPSRIMFKPMMFKSLMMRPILLVPSMVRPISIKPAIVDRSPKINIISSIMKLRKINRLMR